MNVNRCAKAGRESAKNSKSTSRSTAHPGFLHFSSDRRTNPEGESGSKRDGRATVLQITKDGVRVQLNSLMLSIVRAQQAACVC
ncbi:hypothetical protein ACLK1S_11455 [Escherichia coli]